VFNKLKGLKPEYFQREKWFLLLTPEGKTFFSK